MCLVGFVIIVVFDLLFMLGCLVVDCGLCWGVLLVGSVRCW